MPDLVMLAVGGLATWRLSHLLLYEAGPFQLLRKGRERLGVEYDELGSVVSFRYEITTCIFCLSVWVGGLVALLLWLWPLVALWGLLPFALSAMSCFLGSRK